MGGGGCKAEALRRLYILANQTSDPFVRDPHTLPSRRSPRRFAHHVLIAALSGTAICNGLLALVIKMEEGEALDAEMAGCLGGAMSLASGLPFFVLSVLVAMVWFLISKFKHLEPVAEGRAEGAEEVESA